MGCGASSEVPRAPAAPEAVVEGKVASLPSGAGGGRGSSMTGGVASGVRPPHASAFQADFPIPAGTSLAGAYALRRQQVRGA